MTRIEPPVEAVIFDWDNTLVDSWGTIHDALNATLKIMGHPPWSVAETKARTRESLRDAFPKLFGEHWEAARDHYLGHFEAYHLDRLKALEGAQMLLEALRADGIWLGIVSNKTGRLLRREVTAIGWEHYFKKIVGAGDATFDKPHRDPIDLVLTGSGIETGPKVWFVGDTDIDVKCAIGAKCIPILIHMGEEEASEVGRKLQYAGILKSYDGCAAFMEAYEQARACKMGAQ